MTARPLTILLLFGLFSIGCGNRGKLPGNGFAGKFLLSERPLGAEVLDAIEFHPDGTCLVDIDERNGVAAKYETSDGHLRIETDGTSQKEYAYPYQLLNYTLTLQQNDGTRLIYVRMPGGPRPQFKEILGIFGMHNELGDTAGEITADYKFRDHLHDLIPDDHTYYDIHMDGTCSYSNGVVTYVPEHSDAPQQDKYLRDYIIKRDTNGLWQIDPFHDTVVCAPPASNFDLPPIPSGYRNARLP